MSIETYNCKIPQREIEGIDYMDEHHILGKYRLREGWGTWQKIRKKFKLKKFSLISYPITDELMEIAIIHQCRFMKVVQENITEFRQLLGQDLTPKEILEGYLDGTFTKLVRSHEGLFGTLLGYGKTNSWMFMEDQKSQMGYFGDDSPEQVKLVLLPMFRAADTQETRRLEFEYRQQRMMIDKIYSDGRFLTLSLMKLTQESRCEGSCK